MNKNEQFLADYEKIYSNQEIKFNVPQFLQIHHG